MAAGSSITRPARNAGRWAIAIVILGWVVTAVLGGESGERRESPQAGNRPTAPAPVDVIEAIESGNSSGLERLLKLGANPNASSTETTPLGHAIVRRNRAAVQALLKAGADVTQGDPSPLAVAASVDDAALVDALVAAGADPNARFGRSAALTPLMWAALWDNPYGIGELVSHGARLNDWNLFPAEKYRNRDSGRSGGMGRTALMVAASRGHLRSVYRLLQLGADPTLRNEDGDTAMSLTREYPQPNRRRAQDPPEPTAGFEALNKGGELSLTAARMPDRFPAHPLVVEHSAYWGPGWEAGRSTAGVTPAPT